MHVVKRERRITGTGRKGKTPVSGVLEHGAKFVRRRHRLKFGSLWKGGPALYTDALLSYEGLAGDYAHQVIDQAVKYVDGKVHTNGLENLSSLLKRGLNGPM